MYSFRILLVTAIAVIAATTAAHAQGEELAVDATIDFDAGVRADASADRAWLAPTAHTQPQGSWTFSDHELFVVGVGYGVTDKLQISASTMIPVTDEAFFVGTLSAKQQVYSAGRIRLAAHGMIIHANDGTAAGTGASVGGAATLCLDDACHSGVNAYAGTAFLVDEEDSKYPLFLSASIVQRLTDHVKLVGEVDTGFVLSAAEADDALLGWYGARFTSGAIAANVGFVKPFGSEVSTEELPIGLPWVSFTYRAM